MRKSLIIILLLFFGIASLQACSSAKQKTTGEIYDDAKITTEINAKILKDPQLHYLQINVDTNKGNVILKGSVPNPDAEARLIRYAQETKGVKSVTSELKVQPPAK